LNVQWNQYFNNEEFHNGSRTLKAAGQ